MPYFSGVLTGIVLTIIVVFLVDTLGDHPDSQDIVRWDLLADKVGAGAKKIGDEVREEVHDATAPEPETAPPAATEPPSGPATTDSPDAQ